MSHRVCASLLAILTSSSAALAGTKYVDVSLTTGANDGSSWANAFQGVDGLVAAVASAALGDDIWVADGTYKPTATSSRGSSFALLGGVRIYGGFAGGETTLDQRDVAANVAVLSGDLAGNDGAGIFTDNSYHVVNGTGADPTAVLDGFTITGGNANGGAANQDRGGGILCVGGASPTLRNCRFVANRCTFGGGAGYVNGSSPSFLACEFVGNLGGAFGGAFDMANGVGAFFDRCYFEGNSAARAGALEIFGGSSVKVYNSLFVGNTATGSGGGGALYISGSGPQIRNCTILGNAAPVQGTGGILGASSAAAIVNCIVRDNTGISGNTGSTAQLNPSNLNVTYSIVPPSYPGTGNVFTAPTFDPSCGPHPYRLALGSAGVDAGNAGGFPAAVFSDLAGAPRFVDIPSVPDTGTGAGPAVDIGAFESDPDCNGNGTPDWCDIDGGTSLDVNGNLVPDECECQGGVPPTTYCTAKLNSQFCLPSIGFQGYASASNFAPFPITADDLLNQKSGLLFYGYQANSAPFQGGTLCVRAPIRRTGLMNTGGSPTGLDCTGTFSFDFNAYIATGADPLVSVVGAQVHAQYWSRDPQDPFTTSLTDAVEFRVCQ
jgi:hypothetical protein